MDARARGVLDRFVGKLGGEVQVAVRRGSGATDRWGTSTTAEETITRFAPEDGVVELLLSDGRQATVEPHSSGWWVYEAGGFIPEPPCDAARRRRR